MPRRTIGRKAMIATVAGLLGLAGCALVPPATIKALHAFDLSTVNPAELRLAVRTPGFLVLDNDAPELAVTVVIGGAAPVVRRYRMVEVTAPGELAPLAGEARSGAVVRAYGLDAPSARELEAYLDELRRSAAAGSRQLATTLAIQGCRNDGGQGGAVPVTTFIRLAPDQPYLVLTRQRDLSVLAAMGGYDAEVPACR